MIDLRFTMALAAAAWLACATPAHARADPAASRSDMSTVSEETLANQRGGFRWAGLDISFGAELRSYVGSELVMRTTVRWGDVADVQRVAGFALTNAEVTAMHADMAAAGSLSANLAGEDAAIANQGRTVFVQRVDGAIQNIILNAASNVDLRQQVDATLGIGGFAPFSAGLVAARVGSALSVMRDVGG